MKKSALIKISLILLFFLTRIYILTFPPYIESKPGKPGQGYSDVKQDSERYANMWHYGLTPYRKHLYEYPPIAIPFVYLPLLIDQAGIGHYYSNYRFQIFLFEIILFFSLLHTVVTIWKQQPLRQFFSLAFYCLIGVIGKDFWYDGLDLLYIGFFTLALMIQYHTQTKLWWQKVIFWSLFSASFGIKYMTLPLALPILWLRRKQWQREIVCGLIGFIIIWGLPIALYRSSLSVMVYYHTVRPFNYGSFGTWIILAINDFSHTEIQTNILPHLPIVGIVSTILTKIFAFLFPLSILITISYAIYKAHYAKNLNKNQELRFYLTITLTYFMGIFLTNKVFSNPFHIWYAPLITLLPLGSIKESVWLMLGAVWMFVLDTTPWIRIKPPLNRLRDFTRFIPMFAITVWSLKQKK